MNTVYPEVEPKRAEIDALQGPALLEFGSPWCGYRRAAQPLLAAALRDQPRVRHIKIADASDRRLVRPSDSYALREAPARIDSAQRRRLI
jgi:thioredoxin 1